MTVVDRRPAGADTRSSLSTWTSPPADVPVLVSGTQLLGVQPGSGYVTPPLLVCRADGQVMQLTPLLYAVLEAVDGERDLGRIARLVSGVTDYELHPDDIEVLVEDKLRPLGLVLGRDGTHPPFKRTNPLLALRARFVVSRPEVTRRVTAPFAVLFNPVLVVVTTVAFALVAFWVLFEKGLASAAYDAFRRPGLLLAVFAITVVSAGFHEFGHAAALRRGGGTPGAMGAGLYLIYPAFYTDVTDSYRLGRAARIRTDLGGLYFNALAALAMFGGWALTRWDGLLLVIAAQILQMVRQLPPLVRFDGYHLLADITGVPDLFHRIGPTLRSFLPKRWRRAESRELKLWARVVVTLWTLLVVPVLVMTMLLSVIALPRIIGTTAHSVTVQWQQLMQQEHAGHAAGVGVKVLAIAALVIPVGGILYLIARMVRSYAVRIWTRTRGKPGKRALAGLLTLAMLGGLAYAWYPREGTYRPIQPNERGTVQDAVTAAPLHRPTTASTSLQVGEQRTARTIWPAGTPLPTADRPVVALVMTPKQAGSGLPTWVFPFDRPAPPRPGDNQALAIVTRDGGTAYDVAFALVWANRDAVLNANEAYAFASCRRCVAVAVAFQVVLVVGDAHLVAPANISEAINYACISCVTAALAVQLVLNLPDRLSHRAMVALRKLWARIRHWSKHLQGLTFAKVEARIRRFEKEIVAIVGRAEPVTAGPSSSPSPGVDGSMTPTPTPDGSVVPIQGSTSSPAGSATSSPSPTPSAGGSTSGSDSPQPSPTATDPDPSPSPSG
jgi:putative peptide zinc metalloprotease protein